jgi:hypothetical protein
MNYLDFHFFGTGHSCIEIVSPIRNKPLVLGTAMCALTTKKTLIPTAACFDIMHANQWLWAHGN